MYFSSDVTTNKAAMTNRQSCRLFGRRGTTTTAGAQLVAFKLNCLHHILYIECWWHADTQSAATGSECFQRRCVRDGFQSRSELVRLVSQQCRCSASHQRSFKIRCGRRRPGGRYDAVDWVLLLGVDVLHVEWRAVLGLALGLLSVQAAVHATVAILCKECVDGLYPGLSAWGEKKQIRKRARS